MRLRFNILFIVLFTFFCIAFAQSIELVSPQDNYQTSEDSIAFSFYFNSSDQNFDSAICYFVCDEIISSVGSIEPNTSHTYYLNSIRSSLQNPFSYHTWQIKCDLFNSQTNETLYDAVYSQTQQFEIIPTLAQLQIISPNNNHVTSSKHNTFTFLYSPKDTGPINPICYLDVGASRVAQIYANADSFSTIDATLNRGTHSWRISCTDDNFNLQSPVYSLTISSLPTSYSSTSSSGGGEVSKPYYREIVDVEPIKTYQNQKNDSNKPILNSTNSNTDTTNSDTNKTNSKIQSYAVLQVPKYSVENKTIQIRAFNLSSHPIKHEFLQVINPKNQISYLLTDENGSATFVASIDGVYLYKMQNYILESIPSTIVQKNYVQKKLTSQPVLDSEDISTITSTTNFNYVFDLKSNEALFWGVLSIIFVSISFALLFNFSKD